MIGWLKRWGGWLLAAVLGLLAVLAFRRRPTDALKQITIETRAIRSEAAVEKLAAKRGTGAALEIVEAEHAETLEALNEDETATANALKRDPARLSAFLVRAGRR